jgi:hypothetical protein
MTDDSRNQPRASSGEVFAAQETATQQAVPVRLGRPVRAPQFLFMVLSAVMIVAVISHLLAAWFGFPPARPTYRRIGPEKGGQIYCAGSSLLQFGLSWEEVSKALGEGVENWGVGGSSPSEWDVLQDRETNANMLMVGISLYDMNEARLCDDRANIVPMTQTVKDLFQSHSGWQFSKRVLSQYPLAYLRHLFPTAGRSREVMVGLRMQVRRLLRLSGASEDRARVAFLPSGPVLRFGETTDSVSDWSPAKAIRRVSELRTDNHGTNTYEGPKSIAFQRMLQKAKPQGRIVVVILPVSPAYAQSLLTADEVSAFENALEQERRAFPEALFVRLDQVPGLNSNDCFQDLVHLNSAGRKIATAAFLKDLEEHPSRL